MASRIPLIFVDTDVCLDLLSARKPFNTPAERLFSLADLHIIHIHVSSLSFANLDYILRSQYKRDDSRRILAKFKTLVTVLPVGDTEIALAIASEFTDFEDAIQYYTAIENKIPLLITRNVKDYKRPDIKIMRPETFLSGR